MLYPGAKLSQLRLGASVTTLSSAPFTPPTPPPVAGYYDWFASRQILVGSPFNPSDGDAFSEWDTLSGSGDQFAANNTPPVYNLNSLNGTLPVATFDGTGYMLNGLPTLSGVFTFFWVGKLNANGSGGTPAGILSIGSPTGLGQGITLAENGGTYQVFGNDGTTTYGPAFSSSLSWGINCLSYDGTTLRVWINGALVMVTAVSLSIPFLNIYLAFGFGSIDSALCSFFELDVYTTAISIANLNALGAWYSGTGTGAPATGLTWTLYVYTPTFEPGLAAWYDGSQLAGSIGATVATLPDLSGSGNPFIQGSVLARPTLSAGPNSLNSLQFNGISQFMTTASVPFSESLLMALFFVYKVGATVITLISNGNNSANGWGLAGNSGGNLGIRDFYAGGKADRLDGSFSSTFELCVLQSNGTTASARVNGVSQFITNSTIMPNNPTGVCYLANDASGVDFCDLQFCEMVLYPSIDAAGLSRMESYLTSKWGPF